MIKGLGTDLVEVSRMALKINKPKFLALAFTKSEINYCELKKNPAQHFAARFAAKEAYMKAIGTGWSNKANFKEIEVLNNEEGAPNINLYSDSLAYFNQSKYKHIFVTLTHTVGMASATVIITA